MALSPEKSAADRSNTTKPKRRDRPARCRNSSLNAIRAGVFAQSILLPGESRERLPKLLADRHNGVQPLLRHPQLDRPRKVNSPSGP